MDNGRSFGEQEVEVTSPERASSWQLSTVLVKFVRLMDLDKISMSSVNSALLGRRLQNHSLSIPFQVEFIYWPVPQCRVLVTPSWDAHLPLSLQQ